MQVVHGTPSPQLECSGHRPSPAKEVGKVRSNCSAYSVPGKCHSSALGQHCSPLFPRGLLGKHVSLWLAGSWLRRGLCPLSRPWWPWGLAGQFNSPVHPASLWEPGPAHRWVEGAENTREELVFPDPLSSAWLLECTVL